MRTGSVWRAEGSRALRLTKRRPGLPSGLCFVIYKVASMRPLVLRLLDWLEGGVMFSHTWRRIAKHYHDVSFGAFSYGPDLKPGSLPPGTKVGRFCSIARGVCVLRRNHPLVRISQHPLFYNAAVGLVSKDNAEPVQSNPLSVGHDVWIGQNAIICPNCRFIGNGAVIGAGAVVTHDVPAYAIVAGNPARLVRKRFTPELEAAVESSQWWMYPLELIVQHLGLFTRDLDPELQQRFKDVFRAQALRFIQCAEHGNKPESRVRSL